MSVPDEPEDGADAPTERIPAEGDHPADRGSPAGEAPELRYVVVRPEQLSEEALEALLQEFVTREGTDYGLREYSLQEKVQNVRRQLERGEVVIAFDLEQSSATLLTRNELARRARA